MRKTYDKEFKLQAVRMVKEDGKRIVEVARELDVAEPTLHNWVKKYNQGKDDVFVGSGYVQPEKKMEYDLQKRIRDLEEENAILKRLWASSQKTRSNL
ncbi:transposase IS3/IS911 family protein [Gracilibacillus halophilus YIM-C55.5]|uniref:Transposase IS3/IS911 family protein n=1 Tax=Gracilibacillus halophilus YIM-C55.5 TaxID=1308866 RepID=N4WPT5_9BACI|nr:transposase [Gracilibacillus halophilus]ENH98117.1 transposase IS3/IS911 family protein [Gracilibacillus halophilus YIM-C55.5]